MSIKSSRREFLSAGLMLPVAGAASNLDLLNPEKPTPKVTKSETVGLRGPRGPFRR